MKNGGVSVKIHADASGQTLQKLSDLVGKRVAYMNESARYAVGAIAIDALRSIRSATRKRRKGKRVKIG